MENMEKELEEIEERELKELELMNENENREFYVYVHIRLDNNTVFYVGKGHGNRAYNLSRGKGTHHDNICKACGCKAVIIKDNLTESQAFRLESKMIKYYVITLGYGINIEGYDDYDHELPYLTNFTWGGEGVSGRKHSEEEKQKMSKAKKGKKNSKEHNKNISKAKKGKKNSKEHNKNISKSLKGIQFSEERNKKISKSLKGIQFSEEHKQNIGESVSGEKNGMWGKPSPNRSKVICITTGETFDSIKIAAEKYNIYCTSISHCCKGKYKSAGKLQDGTPLQWKYSENDDNESKVV